MKDNDTLFNKQILVTGGAGFLGSHLCERLLSKNYGVIGLDNFFTGSKTNIEPFQQHPHFKFLQHDITQPLLLEIDEIYNLACPASPVHYQSNPIHTIKTNVMGAINVLDLAYLKSAKVLQASTSEVYGDPKEHPQKETYWGWVNPIGIRACYDEGKRCAETLFFDYHRCNQVPIKVARIFNTYGPRMHPNDGRVVSNFIMQSLQDQPITIYGNGKQTRSFCYVDDLVTGLISLMESSDDIVGPLNLGNPHECSILEIAETIRDLTHSKSPIHFLSPLQDDPVQRRPDIEKAQQLLHWQPTISLVEGLTKTIAYFDDILCRDKKDKVYAN